jgi:hypothetical protein
MRPYFFLPIFQDLVSSVDPDLRLQHNDHPVCHWGGTLQYLAGLFDVVTCGHMWNDTEEISFLVRFYCFTMFHMITDHYHIGTLSIVLNHAQNHHCFQLFSIQQSWSALVTLGIRSCRLMVPQLKWWSSLVFRGFPYLHFWVSTNLIGMDPSPPSPHHMLLCWDVDATSRGWMTGMWIEAVWEIGRPQHAKCRWSLLIIHFSIASRLHFWSWNIMIWLSLKQIKAT